MRSLLGGRRGKHEHGNARFSIDLGNFATGRVRGSSLVVPKLRLPIPVNLKLHNLEEGGSESEGESCT